MSEGVSTQRLHTPTAPRSSATYTTGVHTLSHLRANAGTPTPAAVHRGEAGRTRWAALAHYVRRSAAHRARGSAATDSPSAAKAHVRAAQARLPGHRADRVEHLQVEDLERALDEQREVGPSSSTTSTTATSSTSPRSALATRAKTSATSSSALPRSKRRAAPPPSATRSASATRRQRRALQTSDARRGAAQATAPSTTRPARATSSSGRASTTMR